MKELKELYKKDKEIMRVLKVDELRHIIAHTDKGDLSLMIRKDQNMGEYRFVLDAVPMEDEKNKKLMSLFNGVLFTL